MKREDSAPDGAAGAVARGAGVGVDAGERAGETSRDRLPAPGRALVLLLILASLAQAWLTLDRYPDLLNDEAYFAIPAFNLATEGRLANDVVRLAGSERKDLYPFLITLSLAPLFRADPDAGPLAVRAVPLLVSLLALAAVVAGARALFGLPAAGLGLALVLVAGDPLFFMSQRTARPEIWFVLYAALILYGLARWERAWRGPLLCGVTLGLALSTHFIGLPLYVATLAAGLYLHGRRPRPWIFLHGALALSVLPYFLFVVTTENWWALFQEQMAWRYEPAASSGALGWLAHKAGVEADRWADLLAFPYRLHYLALPALAVFCWARGERRIRAAVLLAAVFYVAIAVITPSRFRYFAPAIAVLYLAGVAAWESLPRSPRLRWAPAGIGLGLAAGLGLVLDAGTLFKHRRQSVTAQVAALASAPAGGDVLGEQRLWFAYRHRSFVPWDNPQPVLERSRPGFIWLRKDWHERLRSSTADPSQRRAPAPALRPREEELIDWLGRTTDLARREPGRTLRLGDDDYLGFAVAPRLRAGNVSGGARDEGLP